MICSYQKIELKSDKLTKLVENASIIFRTGPKCFLLLLVRLNTENKHKFMKLNSFISNGM